MATWKDPKTTYTAENQVVPEIFNTLGENEIYLNEKKIETDDVQEAAITSTEATSRDAIASGEKLKTIIGKIRKWLADLSVFAYLDIIDSEHIKSAAITMGKIQSNAVTSGKLATGAVTTAKLGDQAVTTEKIADSAVTKEKIADGSITMEKLSGITQDAITGDIHATTADNVLKNKDGTYTPLVEGADGIVTSGNKIIRTKEPFYIGRIGSSYDDYVLSAISGDNFPTPGQRYEVVYWDNDVKRSFEFIFPEKSAYSYVYLYFCMMFGVTESLSDCKIDSAHDSETYKTIMWKIDHTNKKIHQTRVAAGYSIYSGTMFYGMYKVNEGMGDTK